MKDQSKSPDAERIRELLEKAAPRDEEVVGRADAVTRRARRARTRKGVAGGIGVAALAAAVIVTPHFLKTSPTTNEATDPTNGVRSAEPGAPASILENTCPRQDGLFDGQTDANKIVDGASSIRLCAVQLSGVEVPLWNPPNDALVQVQPFYDLVTAEDEADPARCAATTPAPDPLFFQVAEEGGAVSSAFSPNTCGDIVVGGKAYPVDVVLADYFKALREQRSTLAPIDDAAAECPPAPEANAWTWQAQPDTRRGGGTFTPIVSGAVCYLVDPLGGRAYSHDEGVLTAAQLTLISDDIEANQTRQPQREGGCIDSGPTRLVVLVNAWGDRTTWTDSRCTGEFAGNGGYWLPGNEADDAIADALGGAIPE